MKIRSSLQTVRTRLTLWNVLVLALVLAALGGVLRVSVAHNLMASVDSDLSRQGKHMQQFLEVMSRQWPDIRQGKGGPKPAAPRGAQKGKPPFPYPPEESGSPSQWRTPIVEKLFDAQGKRLFGPENEKPLDPRALAFAAVGQETYSIVRIENQRVRVFSAPIRGEGKIWGVTQTGYSLAEVERSLSNLNRTLLTLMPVALMAAGLSSLFITGRLLRPVRLVTQAAKRIGAEDLSQRLSARGNDEFSELAATFNAMLERLSQSFEQQRRFTADASHELRTPLTVIKSVASRFLARADLPEDYRKGMERIDRAAGMMNGVAQDLLLLAREDAGHLDLPLRPTRLAEALETALACVPQQDGVTVSNRARDTPLIVEGDANHLARLFVNLLDNALRHTPPSGSVTLSAWQEGAAVIVTVEDTGCGIAPEDLPRVCERFYRVDEARTRTKGGSGLGLAICQTIAEAHGGSMEIASVPGQGTRARVCIPASPATIEMQN